MKVMSKRMQMKPRGSGIFIASACILLASVSGVACGEASGLPADKTEAYSFVSRSAEGIRVAAILRENDLYMYGFIDEEGTPITPTIFETAWEFENGGAIVCEQGRWKQIDTTGAVLQEFDPAYTYIHSFNGENGVAVRDGRSALIDATGKALTAFAYAEISRYPLNEALFLATKDPDEDRQDQGPWNGAWSKYGLLSADGKELTAPEYHLLGGAYPNDDGYPQLLAVSPNIHGAGGSCGYLDQNGKEIVPLIYEGANGFWEGVGYVYDGASSKIALIDASGRLLTDFVFDAVLGFHEGLSLAIINEGEYSVIDRSGAVLLRDIGEPQGEFQNGYLKTMRDGEEILIESPIKQSRRTQLYVNDLWVYTDREPLIADGRTLIPARQLADALGYEVSWDAERGAVTIQNRERIIRMTVDSPYASVNLFDDGKPAETVETEVPPRIEDGRTLIPLRFAAEAFGAEVEWREESRSVMVYTQQ